MIDDRTQAQVRRRLKWTGEDIQGIKDKSLELIAQLGPLNGDQGVLWIQITNHIANIESHVHNMLERVPEQ